MFASTKQRGARPRPDDLVVSAACLRALLCFVVANFRRRKTAWSNGRQVLHLQKQDKLAKFFGLTRKVTGAQFSFRDAATRQNLIQRSIISINNPSRSQMDPTAGQPALEPCPIVLPY